MRSLARPEHSQSKTPRATTNGQIDKGPRHHQWPTGVIACSTSGSRDHRAVVEERLAHGERSARRPDWRCSTPVRSKQGWWHAGEIEASIWLGCWTGRRDGVGVIYRANLSRWMYRADRKARCWSDELLESVDCW